MGDKEKVSKRPEHGFVFYKNKYFRPGRSGFDKTGSYGARSPFFIHFHYRVASDFEFCVLSAHLDPSDNHATRMYAADSAAYFLKSSPVPTFFLGDFNLYENERKKFYGQLPECDSCQEKIGFKATCGTESYDDIVFQRAFVSLEGDARVVPQVDGEDGKPPSDHDPLVATFRIRPASKTNFKCDVQRWNLKQLRTDAILLGTV